MKTISFIKEKNTQAKMSSSLSFSTADDIESCKPETLNSVSIDAGLNLSLLRDVEYVNCPECGPGRPVEGKTDRDVVDKIIKQLQQANIYHRDAASVPTVLNELPTAVKNQANKILSFIQSIQGRYKPSERERNTSSLMSELYDAFKEEEDICSLLRAFTVIADSEEEIRVHGTQDGRGDNLHRAWLAFYQCLMSPIMIRKSSSTGQDKGRYSVMEFGNATFNFFIKETKRAPCSFLTMEKMYNMKVVPGATYLLDDSAGRYNPYLIIEVKSCLGQLQADSTDEDDLCDWLKAGTASGPDESLESINSPKPKRRKAESTIPDDQQSTDCASSDLTIHLQTHHTLHLMGVLKSSSNCKYRRPTKIFGLYAVSNKVYFTCLMLAHPEDLSDQVLDYILKSTCPLCPGDIKYRMVCCDYLDVLNPVHCKAFLKLLAVLQREQTQIRYLDRLYR